MRYYKVYTTQEYEAALERLHAEGCSWYGGESLLSKKHGFRYPQALVVNEKLEVWCGEIRHCPDPTDRRLEETHLKVGDKVVMTDRYGEYYDHKDEIFEITSLQMIGLTPCAFLDHGGLGAYACDGLKRL